MKNSEDNSWSGRNADGMLDVLWTDSNALSMVVQGFADTGVYVRQLLQGNTYMAESRMQRTTSLSNILFADLRECVHRVLPQQIHTCSREIHVCRELHLSTAS